MSESPDPVERGELWVVTDGFGRCRLSGNAGTFPGRISAWSETLATNVTISRSDVIDASPAAWAWIDGFLAGNEPELHEFLGVDQEAADRIADDDPANARWLEALRVFRATGAFPYPLERRPTLPPPEDLPIEPWALAGGEVLRWDRSAWLLQDPQPSITFGLLADTVCAARGHCELEPFGPRHTCCIDCGLLNEVAREA